MFDPSVSEAALSDKKASWYRIDDAFANSSITIERPENSHIYVYDKYGSVVYTTHVKDASDDIPLPADGYILFLG